MALISALMNPLSVPNFSLIGVRVCTFWKILQSVQKEEKTQNFGHSYLGNGWGDFLQILYVESATARTLLQQIWFQSDKETRSYKGVKIMFTFFLLIYSWCGALASWAT